MSRRLPAVLLVAACAAGTWFSRSFAPVDTVALLACGVIAGGSLAALAATRRKAR